jgi:hypothetical protein
MARSFTCCGFPTPDMPSFITRDPNTADQALLWSVWIAYQR